MPLSHTLLHAMGIPAAEQLITVTGFTFHYVRAGSGPRVLLLHGSTVGWGQWYQTMVKLASQYDVIALDLPGIGGSSPVDFARVGSEQIVQLVAQFITALKLEPCSIIGHSFGAWIALRLAQKNAIIEKLILISPLGFADAFPWQQQLLKHELFARFLTTTVFSPTHENTQRFLEEPLRNRAASDPIFIRYVHAHWRERPRSHALWLIHGLLKRKEPAPFTTAELQNNSVPCLLLFGEQDVQVDFTILPARIGALQHGVVQRYAEAGHLLFWDNPDRFHKDILRFLGGKL